jgi:hypothetical protein
MKRGVIMNTIHPYVGITRIRYEGIISARTSEHPLIISAAKVVFFYEIIAERCLFFLRIEKFHIICYCFSSRSFRFSLNV